MNKIRIITDKLFKDYGIMNQSIQKVITTNSTGNIKYIKNPKYIPDERVPTTSAWVAVLEDECETVVED